MNTPIRFFIIGIIGAVGVAAITASTSYAYSFSLQQAKDCQPLNGLAPPVPQAQQTLYKSCVGSTGQEQDHPCVLVNQGTNGLTHNVIQCTNLTAIEAAILPQDIASAIEAIPCPQGSFTCKSITATAVQTCIDFIIGTGKGSIGTMDTSDIDDIANCLATASGKPINDVKPAVITTYEKDVGPISTTTSNTDTTSQMSQNEKDCTTGGGVWDSAKSSCAPAASSCKLDGIGWFVCPVMNFMAKIMDQLYSFLATQYLEVPANFVGDAGVTTAWKAFRDIANVCFVIAFTIIILSQVSSIGVTNYGIKKMLPRLLIAAILVNISLFICQLFVEVSNLLGYGMSQLFNSVIGQFQGTSGGGGGTGGAILGGLLWAVLIAGILAGGALIAISLSVPVILAALLAVMMIVLILIARKVLIILLIAIAPLAFVTYLLPNTESLFKKWYKLFFSLLLLFPIIGAVFGASQMAARIIANTNTEDPLVKLMALGASAIPLFVVPGLLKGALNATGSLGAKLQGWSGKSGSNLKNKIGDSRLGDLNKYRKQRGEINQAKARAGMDRFRGGGRNPLNWGSRMNRLTNHALPNRLTDRYGRTAVGIESKEFEEDVEAARVANQGKLGSEIEDIAMRRGKGANVSEAEHVAAVRQLMKEGNDDQRLALVESSANDKFSQRARESIKEGIYSKGMQSYLGGSIGDKVLRGEIHGKDDVDQAIAETVESGKINAETLVGNGTAVNRIEQVVDDSASGKMFTLDEIDAAGNIVKDPVTGKSRKVNRAISRNRLDGINAAATAAKTTPSTRTRIADNIKNSIDRLETV